jgi:hypothetical protein
MNAKLQSLWETEELTSRPVSKEDKLCEAHLYVIPPDQLMGDLWYNLPV